MAPLTTGVITSLVSYNIHLDSSAMTELDQQSDHGARMRMHPLLGCKTPLALGTKWLCGMCFGMRVITCVMPPGLRQDDELAPFGGCKDCLNTKYQMSCNHQKVI